jgi:hypothetical protein
MKWRALSEGKKPVVAVDGGVKDLKVIEGITNQPNRKTVNLLITKNELRINGHFRLQSGSLNLLINGPFIFKIIQL